MTWVINETEGYEELTRNFFSSAGRSHKIGISGPPGSGKSSLINRLVAQYRRGQERVGILAVDPTSPFTGGAFLGDRLRVQDHVLDSGVFFRSLGSRGMVGGVSATIFSAIHVLETYGCDRILIETVGTGQDEVEISRVADSVVYVTTPSLGDEIQAMKAGAMEAADIFVVNKADIPGVDKAIAALQSALELEKRVDGAWAERVVAASAVTGQGMWDLMLALQAHREFLSSTAEGKKRTRLQLKEELSLIISRRLHRDMMALISENDLDRMSAGRIDPVSLGETLIGKLLRENISR